MKLPHLKKLVPKREIHFLTAKEAADMLGMPKSGIVKLIKSGEFREFRSPGGGSFRVHIDDLYRRLDAGLKVAVYTPIHRSQERAELLQRKAIMSTLKPVYIIEEHLPDTNKPIVWRDGIATAVTMWHQGKISGIVTYKEFVGEVPDTLGWLVVLQRMGFFVYIDEGPIKLQPYPYRVKEFEYIFRDPNRKRRLI